MTEQLILLLVYLFTVAVVLAAPRFAPKNVYLGVTIPDQARRSPTAVAALRSYRLQVLLHAILIFILVVVAGPKAIGFAAVWFMVGSSIAFATSHAKVRTLAPPAERRQVHSASLQPRSTNLPLGWIVGLIPVAAVIGAGMYLYLNQASLPPRFPVHYGFNGPDRFVDTSPAFLLIMMVGGTVMCVTMLLSAIAIMRTRRVAMSGPAARYEDRFRSTNALTVIIAEYLLAIGFAGLPLGFVLGSPWDRVMSYALLLLTLAVVLLALYTFYIKYQQEVAIDDGDKITGDRTPDECWTWGMIYFNADDPAVFVEKRFGIGYTLNFANWLAWAFLLGILIVPLLISVVLR